MFSAQSYGPARNPALRFLLGASCAAVLVLSSVGATLTLSRGGTEAWTPSLNDLHLNQVPEPLRARGRPTASILA